MKASYFQISLVLAVLAFAAFWSMGDSGEVSAGSPLTLQEDAVQAEVEPRLQIRLVDPAGKALPEDWQVAWTAPPTEGGGAQQGEVLKLSVRPRVVENSVARLGPEFSSEAVGDAVYEFRPLEGTSLEVRILGGGYPDRMTKVEVPEGAGLVEVTVVVDKSLVTSD